MNFNRIYELILRDNRTCDSVFSKAAAVAAAEMRVELAVGGLRLNGLGKRDGLFPLIGSAGAAAVHVYEWGIGEWYS